MEIARGLIPGGFIAYTSRSATEDNQKAHLIIQLSEPVSGGVWKALQKILNDKLEAAGVTPDRKSENSGQLCYLPNRGEFYQHHIEADNWKGTMNPDRWADELAAEAEREATEEAEKRAKAEQVALKPKPVNLSGHDAGIIEKVKAAYGGTEGNILEHYDCKRIGHRYLSPHSSTGTPGIILLDGGKVYSHHGATDPLSNMNHNGHALDVFDLLCVLRYEGDFSRAVAELANEVDPEGQRQRQRDHMAAQDAPKADINTLMDGPDQKTSRASVDLLTPPGLAGEICKYMKLTANRPRP